MREAETSPLLTPAEAARLLGQSRQTVYRKVRLGLIPAVRLGHTDRSPLRIPADELDRFLYTDPPEVA